MWGINLKYYSQFLGKNERNKVYLRKNSSEGRRIADSKLKTKRLLDKGGVGVPKLLARFKSWKGVEEFDWTQLTGNFVVKPATGYGGEGIIVIRRGKQDRDSQNMVWQKMDGITVETEEIKRHCGEIISGRYSMHGIEDEVLIEERIKIHPMFLNYTRWGTPDVRVIVYEGVPVMAMLRIPTERSRGKSNLQQGAVGLGIDLATGITTFGVEGKSSVVETIWDRKKKKMIKVNGIKIPSWREVLETAVKSQKVIHQLGFMGIDIVLDKDKGPVVLEVNARPGLSIQICNRAGLKQRINKVDGLEVRSVNHAIMVAKYLFGESFFEKVEEKASVKTIQPLEVIGVKIPKGFHPELTKSSVIKIGKNRVVEVRAKVDTGAYRSSIDEKLARKLGLLEEEKVLYYRHYRSSLGKAKNRPVVAVTFWLKGRKVSTAVNVANRDKLRTKILLGRKDLEGFLVSAVKEVKKVESPKLIVKRKKLKIIL
ncbi:MAG: sugar-transfer associated ATP-grasp domain-containing protein [Candidatus Shapirobacteria bacterium]